MPLEYVPVVSLENDLFYMIILFMQSNPVLEAFGNAKTVRNNNSRSSFYTTLSLGRKWFENYLVWHSKLFKYGIELNLHI